MDPLPLSALNDHLYCERQANLIHAERVFIDYEHTLLGNLAHEAADTAPLTPRLAPAPSHE